MNHSPVMLWRAGRARRAVGTLSAAAVLVLLASGVAWAQAHHPFSVGITEGGGSPTGLSGWLLAQQGLFEHATSLAVRGLRTDGSALWTLGGLGFLYGVLHAAGPGHGKAVLAAYMLANERALRRGIVLAGLAALLQAAVAIVLVAALSLLLHLTQAGMREGAALIEKASYAALAVFGFYLLVTKARALREAWAERHVPAGLRLATAGADGANLRLARPAEGGSGFACTDGHVHGPGCGHVHAPDPRRLGAGFSWPEAIGTVVTAGARPCSGAILVLVFALAQGVFAAGIAATLLMALGTALTTAALASLAVLARGLARRLSGGGESRAVLVLRGLECAAAVLVMAVGLSLLVGVGPLQALS